MKKLKNQQGGTVLELILGLVVASLITYSLAPSMGNMKNNTSLDAAAKKIELELRYAQSLAMTTRATHGFRTNRATSANKQDYSVYEISDSGSRVVVTSPHDHQPMREDLSDSFEEVTFSGDYTVEFDDKGKPLSGSDLAIVITLPADSSGLVRSKTISLDSYTGNITATASQVSTAPVVTVLTAPTSITLTPTRF